MIERVHAGKWPDDTAERIASLRSVGAVWEDIALSFGVSLSTIRDKAINLGLLTPKAGRRFDAGEDAIIRADYLANADLKETANKLGRTYGDVRQRIFHHHKDLLNSGRTGRGTKALKRYGPGILAHGETPDAAAQALKAKMIAAKVAARVAAQNAKAARRNFIVETMMNQIAEGRNRNQAIFEARACGVELVKIAEPLGITRERVRQICDATALEFATNPPVQNDIGSRDWLVVSGGKL